MLLEMTYFRTYREWVEKVNTECGSYNSQLRLFSLSLFKKKNLENVDKFLKVLREETSLEDFV